MGAGLAFCFLLLAPATLWAKSGFSINGADWQSTTPAERAMLLHTLGSEKLGFHTDYARTQKQKLSWTDASLYRVWGAWEPSNLVFYFISNDVEKFHQLDGTSAPIHAWNAANPPRLTEANVADYLWFFNFFVRTNEGPFLLVESRSDPFVPKEVFSLPKGKYGLDEKNYRSIADVPRPISCRARQDARYECGGVIYYSNAIMEVNYLVRPDGKLEMLNDRPVVADLPVKVSAPVSIRELGDVSKFVPRKKPVPKPRTPSVSAPMHSAPGTLPDPPQVPGSNNWLDNLMGFFQRKDGLDFPAVKARVARNSPNLFRWEDIWGHSFINLTFDGRYGWCNLMLQSDDGRFVILYDGLNTISVGSTALPDSFSPAASVDVYLGGVHYATLSKKAFSKGTSTGLTYLSGQVASNFLSGIGQHVRFSAQLAAASDIDVVVAGTRVRKTMRQPQSAGIFSAYASCHKRRQQIEAARR